MRVIPPKLNHEDYVKRIRGCTETMKQWRPWLIGLNALTVICWGEVFVVIGKNLEQMVGSMVELPILHGRSLLPNTGGGLRY